jgi:hypothetical protein
VGHAEREGTSGDLQGANTTADNVGDTTRVVTAIEGTAAAIEATNIRAPAAVAGVDTEAVAEGSSANIVLTMQRHMIKCTMIACIMIVAIIWKKCLMNVL